MSMPFYAFECTRCDFQAHSRVVWGQFSYLIDDTHFLLKRDLGWCDNCLTLVPIEVFPDSDSIEALESEKNSITLKLENGKTSLREKQSRLTKFVGLKPRLSPHLKRLKAQFRLKSEQIQDLKDHLKALSYRKSGPKCLSCGSQDLRYLPPLPDIDDGEKEVIPFEHPNCGGNLTVSWAGVRINQVLMHRIYDSDGNFLSQTAVKDPFER